MHDERIELPIRFPVDNEDLPLLLDGFRRIGIEYQLDLAPGGHHTFVLSIRASQARDAARFLRGLFYPDPIDDQPELPPRCEGCGEEIGTATECPHCGLTRAFEEERDDLLEFIREHLGRDAI